MILQRLVEYYDRLAANPATRSQVPQPGYSWQKVSFCVVLNEDGSLQQFQSLLDEGGRSPRPRQLLVPGEAKPTGSGINPGFLWDGAPYMLGFTTDSARLPRTERSFEAFRDKHLALEQAVDDEAFSAVCRFLREWTPHDAQAHAAELEPIATNFGVFRLAGEQRYVHDRPAVAAHIRRQQPSDAHDHVGRCLVTGVAAPIARLHEPKIKRVSGAQPSGALLVSFNEPAYESYDKTQSFNAPVSASAAFKYANALNYLLLRRDDRRLLLGDATIVFWADQPSPLEDVVSDLLGEGPHARPADTAEDVRRAESVRLFLSQLREGRASVEALGTDSATRFYVLGLSPNASRISVRLWCESTVAELKDRLARHLRDVELVGARDEVPLSVRAIVRATGRAEADAKGRVKRYDDDGVSPLLAGGVARAVLTGGPYPETLLSAVLRRFRADGVVNHVRVAAVKACITRNARIRGTSQEVPVALDVNRTEPAYVTGRLFAVLEKIQKDSAGSELNATIRDRYFSSASATPAVVFPRLLRLTQHHLAKLSGGTKVVHEKQLGEIVNKLVSFAPYLQLQDQGLFAVGYFHQRQAFFTARKDTEDATS